MRQKKGAPEGHKEAQLGQLSSYVGLQGVQPLQGEGDPHLPETHLQKEADHVHELTACLHSDTPVSAALKQYA